MKLIFDNPITNLAVLFIIGTSRALAQPIYDGCDTTRSCAYLPTDCQTKQPQTCQFVGSFTRTTGSQVINFELFSSRATKYVSLGFSTDRDMGEDAVVACFEKDSAGPKVIVSENIGKDNQEGGTDSQAQVTDATISVDKGSVTCKFKLPTLFEVGQVQVDFATKKYFTLIAGGDVAGGKMAYHAAHRGSFDIEMHEVNEVAASESNSSVVKIIHVVGMLFSFLFFIPLGTFISRFYKETWADVRFFKRRLWFLLHVACMLTALLISIISYLVLAVEIDYFSGPWYFPTNKEQTGYTHNIIGLLALILLLIQSTTHWWHSSVAVIVKIGQVLHYWNGSLVYLLGLINIAFTTSLVYRKEIVCDRQLPILLWLLIHFAFYCGMSALTAWTDWHLMNGGLRTVSEYPMPISSTEEAPRPRIRKGILLAFAITAFIVTILVIVFAWCPHKPYGRKNSFELGLKSEEDIEAERQT